MIKILIMGNLLFWFLFVLSGEAVTLMVGVLNFLGIVIVALINAQQNKRISKLSTNIDGKMDALLDANKRADTAVGAEAGRQQKRTEDREDKIDTISLPSASHDPVKVIIEQPENVEPVKVVVTKPADVNIVEDKTKEKK